MLVAFIGETLVLQSRRRSNEDPTAQQGQDQGNKVLDFICEGFSFFILLCAPTDCPLSMPTSPPSPSQNTKHKTTSSEIATMNPPCQQ